MSNTIRAKYLPSGLCPFCEGGNIRIITYPNGGIGVYCTSLTCHLYVTSVKELPYERPK